MELNGSVSSMAYLFQMKSKMEAIDRKNLLIKKITAKTKRERERDSERGSDSEQKYNYETDNEEFEQRQ